MTLAPDELQVAVEHVAVGASERRRFAAPGSVAPGRALVGRVVATGSAATDQQGRRVLVGPLSACGECDTCRRGRLASCASARRLGVDVDGGLAGTVVARRRWVCPLDGALEKAAPGPEAALLAHDVPLAYALIARAGLSPGDVAIWLGDDFVAEIGRELTRALGAHAPVVAGDDVVASARAALVDVTAALPPPPCWRVFVTAGAPLRTAASLAALGCTVGIAAPDERHDLLELAGGLGAGLSLDSLVFGLGVPHPDLVPEVAALVARGDVKLEGRARVVSRDQLPGALEHRGPLVVALG